VLGEECRDERVIAASRVDGAQRRPDPWHAGRLPRALAVGQTHEQRRHDQRLLAAVRARDRLEGLADRLDAIAAWCVSGTMKGSSASTTYRMIPFAMRRFVASASSRVRSKMLGAGSSHMMHSAAVRYGFALCWRTGRLLGGACVCVGTTMGSPSQRATRNRRLRIVGVPRSQARSSW
jgi:hypothetical protein